jgi:hypothetical protein
VGNRKKGGWFPLQEGSLYSSFDQQREESETPYLLDPIDLTDVNLLAFDEEGKAIPIPKASAWEQQRVVETVKRLKLNEHAPLGEERRKVWQQMDGLIEEYQLALSRNKNGGNPAAKEKARKTAKAIKDRISPTAELSSVAKYCLWFRNDEYLNRLIS